MAFLSTAQYSSAQGEEGGGGKAKRNGGRKVYFCLRYASSVWLSRACLGCAISEGWNWGDEGEAKNVGGGVKAAVDDMSQSPGAYTCTILHTQAEGYRELAGDTVDRYSR